MLETDDDLYEQIYNYSFYKGKCMGYLQGTIKFHKKLIRLENKYQKYVRRHPGEVIDERHSDMHLFYLEYLSWVYGCYPEHLFIDLWKLMAVTI